MTTGVARMASVSKSSLFGPLEGHRRELVVDLACRSGVFWEQVESIRSGWAVSPMVAIPPEIPRNTLHSPMKIPDWSPPAPLDQLCRELVVDLDRWVGQDLPLGHSYEHHWKRVIEELLFETVPPALRLGAKQLGIAPMLYRVIHKAHNTDLVYLNPWATFLSGCILYDPPDTDLDAFANCAAFPTPRLQAAPIVHIRDPDQAALLESTRANAMLVAIVEEVQSRHGVDIRDIVNEVLWASYTAPQYWKVALENVPQPYIDPTANPQDIEQAIESLGLSRSPSKRGRPPHDRLHFVQCAFLRDRGKWSWERIGKRYGFACQKPTQTGGEVRCESARKHCAEGREIIRSSERSRANTEK